MKFWHKKNPVAYQIGGMLLASSMHIRIADEKFATINSDIYSEKLPSPVKLLYLGSVYWIPQCG